MVCFRAKNMLKWRATETVLSFLLECELAARIPLRDHLGGEDCGKAVFRRAVRGLIPKELLGRKKRGFGIPVDRWLREFGYDDDEGASS